VDQHALFAPDQHALILLHQRVLFASRVLFAKCRHQLRLFPDLPAAPRAPPARVPPTEGTAGGVQRLNVPAQGRQHGAEADAELLEAVHQQYLTPALCSRCVRHVVVI
jgi:hypothetical protein